MDKFAPNAKMEKLSLQDDENNTEDPFAVHNDSRPQQPDPEARDARLRAELERVREVNKVIENVTASLSKAKDNMQTVHRTVSNASTLLATWTRILSQTEHNQRLILNPNWHGASKDIEDIENEEVQRQRDAERRAAEEVRRKEEVQRRAEDEERKRAAAASAPTGRGRGRIRGTSAPSVRGTRASTRGYTGLGGQATGRGRGTSTSSTTGTGSRAGSGIGRTALTRGRGRGVG